MSSPGADSDRPDLRARFGALESAVEGFVDHSGTIADRLAEAREELEQLREMFQRFASGEEAPSDTLGRVKELETVNRDLMARIDRARERVDGLVQKIRFLEEHA